MDCLYCGEFIDECRCKEIEEEERNKIYNNDEISSCEFIDDDEEENYKKFWGKKKATDFVTNTKNKILYKDLKSVINYVEEEIKNSDKKSRINKTAPLSFVWSTFNGWLEEKLKTNKPSDEIKRGRISVKTGKEGFSCDEMVVRNILWEFGGIYEKLTKKQEQR